MPQHTKICSKSPNIRRQDETSTTYLRSKANDDDDENVNFGPEKSRMGDYIANFLKRNAKDEVKETRSKVGASSKNDNGDGATFSHLVAIPMETCHELLIELESVSFDAGFVTGCNNCFSLLFLSFSFRFNGLFCITAPFLWIPAFQGLLPACHFSMSRDQALLAQLPWESHKS